MSKEQFQLLSGEQRLARADQVPLIDNSEKANALKSNLLPAVESVKKIAGKFGEHEDPTRNESRLLSPWRQIATDTESGEPIMIRTISRTVPGVRKTMSPDRNNNLPDTVSYVDLQTKLGDVDYTPADEPNAYRKVARFYSNDRGVVSVELIGENGELSPVTPENQDESLPVAISLAEQLEAAFQN